MKESYIGVTGFMTRDEVEEALSVVPESFEGKIMVGVLVSSKTLEGAPNRWVNRYPRIEDVAGIFSNHHKALNLIHYNTDEPLTLNDQLKKLCSLGEENLHGFQLNMAWPLISSLVKFKSDHSDKVIVLQVGGRAFKKVENSPTKLASFAKDYEDLVDYLLLDPSGGYGKMLDVEAARNYTEELKLRVPDLKLGVAGGLSAATLDVIRPLLSIDPDLSWDAEGRLRDSEDHLDLNETKDYLQKSFSLIL